MARPSTPTRYVLQILPLAEAVAFNDAGQIVGIRYAKTPYQDSGTTDSESYKSYVWQRGRLRSLDPPRTHPRTRANAINSKGDIVGEEEDLTATEFPWTLGDAYLWRGRRKIALPPLTLLQGQYRQTANATFANGINNAGTIVGRSGMARIMNPSDSDDWSHAVVWQQGKLTDLGWGEAKAINSSGWVVGTSTAFPDQFEDHAALWIGRQLTVLGGSRANAINNRGEVVGEDYDGGAFLYSHGKTVFLGQGSAVAINDRGQVLISGDTVVSHGQSYLWYSGTRQNISRLAPALARWSDIRVSGLSSSGAIIGYGTFHSQSRAFLLLPTRSIRFWKAVHASRSQTRISPGARLSQAK